jgi:DNA adenine methylase
LDAENLRNVSAAIQNVNILVSSFEAVLDQASLGDFIYFDPPYQPISETAHFTSYTSNNFGEDQQRLLSYIFAELDLRGCYVLLSNSYSDFIRNLYVDLPGVQIEIIAANRAINRDIKKRGKIPEMLIIGKTLSQLLGMEKA